MKVKSQESRVERSDFGFWISDFGLKNSVPNPQSAIRNPQLHIRASRLATRASLGMTLIELLVVVVIITTMVAAAIPLLSPTNDDRRLREASRSVNSFIGGAQAKAVGLHRPYGFVLKRLSQDTGKTDDRSVCVEMYNVEQPAPYTGFDANSRACVALNGSSGVLVRFVTRGTATAGLPMGWAVDLFPDNMIRYGDVIEVNGTQFELGFPINSDVSLNPQTTFYTHTNNARPAIIAARPLNNSGQQINPKYDDLGNDIGTAGTASGPYWTSASPYKILRQPVPTSDEPYQLPEGTAIDLRASGVGSDANNYFYIQNRTDNDQGILVMFSPEGRVARVAFSKLPTGTVDKYDATPVFDQTVADNVFLLVGRRDRAVPPLTSDTTLQTNPINQAVTDEQRNRLRDPINWLSGSSRWIAIGSQTGRITTVDNAYVDLAATHTKYVGTDGQSTEDLRNRQILTSRENVREMGQLGGR